VQYPSVVYKAPIDSKPGVFLISPSITSLKDNENKIVNTFCLFDTAVRMFKGQGTEFRRVSFISHTYISCLKLWYS
jgi:hypothetical protein